ncbi:MULTISPECIES: GTP 3',8-cyclase MoaA [Micromonospora]|uniref:GTP 3',8-cyclase n=2 Tax=Micromonospora TaxID=1873 RepID=A0A9X0LEB5_9ACTN|nr:MULTISPECIES: GTP 3',8-cyclase MoaA [Micromonospora]AEB47919.1 molybdenum cofactor biosynthesis protein a [Micromonospora maris AB-18-032]KUJ46916.1 cyclic pyranopterin phosphate synthase MoaA [Micromonospora maris]MBL6277132.1 GTP 3',8-cyclase MoaA [Micromonospora fiedleri]RUL91612.1 GTP 3',8-cyclase MoaA [Verrucosispora sp. FIM060022]
MSVAPPGGLLVDRYGRTARDLRVSLTDKCNLRCTYCMPAEGLPWLAGPQLLTDDEVIRLVRLAVHRFGVDEVRFTGGEPLIRPGLTAIVAAVAALDPRPRISLTTNGIGLARLAPALHAAGLDRVNVSLDTLDRDRFLRLTRRDRLDDVLAGLAGAAAAGLTPVKVNSVLMRGVNDDEAPALLRFALDHGYELRFIEQMPLDAQHGWDRSSMVTAEEILATLGAAYELSPDPAGRGAAPAETWLVDGGPARVGVIGTVTRPFCGDCDRTRITADGQVRNCLFATEETDLRGALRAGADDDELARRWSAATWRKRAGHGIDDPSFLQPARPMSAIGG